jgi:hypothetical protein
VAVYNAKIDVTVSGQNRLDYVLASVEKLNNIVSRLKPINLLAPGAGEGGDKIRQAKKQLDDFARALVNFEPQGIQKRARELSNTLAGSAAQADALGVALANVGLKSGGFKQQAAEVRNYALALDTATQNADRLSAISRSVQRGARLENIASRFGTTPEAIEQRINNIRDIRYRKQKEAEADEYMQQKRAEDFELRLNKILEKRQQAKQARTTAENVALGAGFPLLFGGGPGSVIGGALGGLIPGNPMLSVVTSAIGDQLDAAIIKVSDVSKAIRQLDFSKLEESGMRVNKALQEQINLMVRLGQTTQAYRALQQETARVTGTIPGTVTDIGNATGLLSAAWKDFTLAASTTLGIIGAPFAAALALIVKGITEIFKLVNSIISLFANGIKTVGEWAIKLVAGEEGLKRIKDLIDTINRLTGQGDTAFTTENLVPLNEQIVLNKQILDLQKQRTSATTTEGRIQNTNIEYRVKLLQNEQDYSDKVVKLNEKKNSLSEAVYIQGLNQLRVLRDQSNEYAKQSRDLEIREARQREAEQRERERQQALEQSYKAQTQATRDLYAAQKDYVDLYVQQLQLSKGDNAATDYKLSKLDDLFALDAAILQTETQQALREAQKTNTVSQVNALYEQRYQNLLAQYSLQRQQLQIEQKRAALEKQLAAQNRRESIQNAVDPIRQQQFRTELDISAFTQPADVVEAQKLALDQRLRAYNTELPILQEINRLTTEINSGTLKGNALEAKQLDLEAEQNKLVLVKEELMLLDQLEQKQLRLQQFFTTYGQLIQSVSGEIANAVTFGVSEMVRGTKTAEQVFADFLQAIGAALLQQAQTMIATYIAIGIARIFAGMGGGGGGGYAQGNVSTDAFSAGGIPGLSNTASVSGASFGSFSGGGFSAGGLAGGGPTRAGTPYLVGERGPELFVPGTSGGVMSNSDLRASMGAAFGASGGPVLNMSFETSTINGVEYVSRDQLEAAMAVTRRQAARDGASRGMSMTLDRLQQSPSTRRKVGI